MVRATNKYASVRKIGFWLV